jgi:hypothetical protein
MLVRSGNLLVVPLDAMEDLSSRDLLVLYVKSKKMLQIIGVTDTDKFDLVNLTMFSSNGDLMRFSVFVGRDVFKKENMEVIWTSGICTPTPEDLKKLGINNKVIKETSCIWDGIIKVPKGIDANSFKEKIVAIDKDHILKSIDVKGIDRLASHVA